MDAWNGIWITGRLAFDTGTRTFRTFRVLRFGGVPLVFLGAYRVYEKDTGGLVFVGRQPLPAWAVAYNLFGVPLVAAAFALFFGSLIEVCR
jgi:hypothetical protein